MVQIFISMRTKAHVYQEQKCCTRTCASNTLECHVFGRVLSSGGGDASPSMFKIFVGQNMDVGLTNIPPIVSGFWLGGRLDERLTKSRSHVSILAQAIYVASAFVVASTWFRSAPIPTSNWFRLFGIGLRGFQSRNGFVSLVSVCADSKIEMVSPLWDRSSPI